MMVHNFFFGIGRIPDKGVKKTSVLELILPLLRYYLFESFVVVSVIFDRLSGLISRIILSYTMQLRHYCKIATPFW